MIRAASLLAGAALAAAVSLNAASAQTIEWVYANGYARNHPNVGVLADEFIRQIEAETDGRLKIRHVAAGTLLKPQNMLDGLSSRVAQMGSAVSFFFPGHLPVSSTLGAITDLKIGNRMDAEGVIAVTARLLEELPEFAAEYEKLNLKAILWVSPPPYGLISTHEIAKAEDLKGLKFRSVGTSFNNLLAAAGAVPLSMAYSEVYTSLQTGVIDGAMSDVNGMVPGRWHEVAKNVLTMGPDDGAYNAIAPIVYVVNLDAWNELPPDIRAAIERVAARIPPTAAKIVADSAENSKNSIRDAGAVIRHLSQAEAEALQAKAPDVYAGAVKSLNDAGLPGQRIIDRYIDIANGYLDGEWKP